ncbi:MAG TPA: serine/threonine-protein kinase [Gemmatimonadaceae bacterium]|nr:serine/threonine-protein kinase [Gemmatimonadaceae bacterium]
MLDPSSSQVQSALGGTYLIEREISGGGMARVFVADDPRLGRRIVVKALQVDAAAHVDAQRFRLEVQWAAALQHPHIVPLLSAGEQDGMLYYTMPFITGESLDKRLARESPLAINEAVRLLRDVADALAYAHEFGIVHRDIKPGNVLLAESHALVTDFGVAKALETASEDAHPVTQTGMVPGTPTYMAPEQVVGDGGLDARADLYSFGVLAYEVLAGRPPFEGATLPAIYAAHISAHAVPLHRLRAEVPRELSRLVMRCLNKDVDRRWRSAREVLDRLEAIQASLTVGREPSLALRARALGLTRPAMARRLAVAATAFVALSLLVLDALHLVISELGLPAWVVPAALGLLGLGFVITLATTARIARWLTWPHATLAGALAWALLAAVVLAYMAARTIG